MLKWPLVMVVLSLLASDATAGPRFRFRSRSVQTEQYYAAPSAPVAPSTAKADPPPIVTSTTVITELHTYANEARLRVGLRALVLDNALTNVAQRWAAHMAATGRFGHGGGEQIIAAGQRSAAEAINDWIRSPGHRAWVLGGSDRAGWGFATGANGTTYWAGAFGGGQMLSGSFSSTETFSGCASGACGTTTTTTRSRFRFR